jgi:hypothetical protein
MASIWGVATHAYQPDAEHAGGELTFKVGDRIQILGQDDPGWWQGELGGQLGLFPSNYIRVELEADAPKENRKAVRVASQERRLDYSQTRVGVWASNMAIYVGSFYVLTGCVLLLYAVFGKSPDIDNTAEAWAGIDGAIGSACVVLGTAIVFLEYKYGYRREGSILPTRALLYCALSVPGYWCFPTRFASVLFIFPILANFYSAWLKEVYLPPQVHA